MNLEIFKEKYTTTKPIPKNCITPDGMWMKGRCRINPKFFPNVIFDYLFSDKERVNICELYLELTRNLDKNNKQYKESHSMDSNTILNWFHIKRNNKNENDKVEQYSYEWTMDVIKEYVNEIINSECFISKIKDEWNNYYQEDIKLNSKYTYKQIIETFNNYEPIVKECEIIKRKIIPYNHNLIFTCEDKEDSEKLKAIGDVGEEIVFNYLVKKYPNLKHVSKDKPYNPYDLEFTINGKKTYIEVKSTSDGVYDHFYISRNEYDFYTNHKDNYWIIYVTNINVANIENNTNVNIYIYKNPILIIDMLNMGFEENKIYITPTKFRG